MPGPEVIRRMTAVIGHRGPDEVADHIEEDLHLGTVRLAVMDPAKGQQPVFGCDSKIVCVYNGMIYNHAALRNELERGSPTHESE